MVSKAVIIDFPTLFPLFQLSHFRLRDILVTDILEGLKVLPVLLLLVLHMILLENLQLGHQDLGR